MTLNLRISVAFAKEKLSLKKSFIFCFETVNLYYYLFKLSPYIASGDHLRLFRISYIEIYLVQLLSTVISHEYSFLYVKKLVLST